MMKLTPEAAKIHAESPSDEGDSACSELLAEIDDLYQYLDIEEPKTKQIRKKLSNSLALAHYELEAVSPNKQDRVSVRAIIDVSKALMVHENLISG